MEGTIGIIALRLVFEYSNKILTFSKIFGIPIFRIPNIFICFLVFEFLEIWYSKYSNILNIDMRNIQHSNFFRKANNEIFFGKKSNIE